MNIHRYHNKKIVLQKIYIYKISICNDKLYSNNIKL